MRVKILTKKKQDGSYEMDLRAMGTEPELICIANKQPIDIIIENNKNTFDEGLNKLLQQIDDMDIDDEDDDNNNDDDDNNNDEQQHI